MDKMREKFENYLRGILEYPDDWFVMNSAGLYPWGDVQKRWEGYQAATAESAQTIAEKDARIAELEARIKGMYDIASQELFADGISADLHESGIDSLADVYMLGRLNLIEELNLDAPIPEEK